MKRTVLMILGVATIVATVWATSGRVTPSPAAGAGARAAEVAGVVAAPGRVEAVSEDIQIGAEITGRLVRVPVDEGDAVMAGQVLAEIDDRDARAKLAAAEARVLMADADLARLVNGARVEERREADAQRFQAETALAQVEIERQRRIKLHEEGAIAREELERADRDARLARARLAELTERARTVDAPARSDEVARANAAISLARAQVSEARASLGKTVIRAPRAGIITRRHRQAGELVSPEAGQSLIVTMADTSRLRVRADVDETDVARVGVGQRVWVRADAYGDQRFGGRVIRIGATLGRKNVRTDDPVERTDRKILETLIELDADATLPLGLRVDVFIGGGK